MFPRGKNRSLSLSLLAVLFLVNCGGGGGGVGGGGEVVSAPALAAVNLSWDTPSSADTGAPMPGLAGYHVYYGTSPGQYSNVMNVGNVTTYTLNLAPGTYFFTITAYDSTGEETEFADEVTKSVQ